MTHVSEYIPSSAHTLGSIWDSFGGVNRPQWQWQAPTTRAPEQDSSAAPLPAWLFERDTTPLEETLGSVDEEVTDTEPTTTVEDDIRHFQKMLKTASGTNRAKLIAEFNQQFKKSLTLGLVSSETLTFALRQVSMDIQKSFPNCEFNSSSCLSFYTAVWEGIEACKVLRPKDFHSGVMNELVSLLAALPVTQEMQALVHKVLHSTSAIQLHHMGHSITSLVKVWIDSWREARPSGECTEAIISAQLLVMEAEVKVLNAQTLTMALENGSSYERGVNIAQEAISSAHTAISTAIDATVKADDLFSCLSELLLKL